MVCAIKGTLQHRDSDIEYDVQLDGVWRATGGMFAFGQDIVPSLTAEGLVGSRGHEISSKNFKLRTKSITSNLVLQMVS